MLYNQQLMRDKKIKMQDLETILIEKKEVTELDKIRK